jgi:hypothetical protein
VVVGVYSEHISIATGSCDGVQVVTISFAAVDVAAARVSDIVVDSVVNVVFCATAGDGSCISIVLLAASDVVASDVAAVLVHVVAVLVFASAGIEVVDVGVVVLVDIVVVPFDAFACQRSNSTSIAAF